MDLLRWTPLLTVTLLLFACGGSPPSGEGPSSCGGACAPNQICTAAEACVCEAGFLDCDGTLENGCETEGAECPKRCSCREGLECDEANNCVRPPPDPPDPPEPLAAREVCERDGESLGSCAAGLDCVEAGTLGWSLCIQRCGADDDCPGAQGCGHLSGGEGICVEPRQAGESCTPWWEGPNDCAGPLLRCLGGSCRIPCDVLTEGGELMTCPQGQSCDGAPTEYPEMPGVPVASCVDRPVRDPCGELPAGGRCSSYQSYERCAEEGSSVIEIDCASSQRCENGPAGATCVPLPSSCVPEHSYCESQTSLMHCLADNTWRRFPCHTGCRDTPEGASCATSDPTSTIQGTLLYERLDPNDSFTDWATSVSRQPAAGLLAMSFQGGELIDTTSVAEDGSFSIRIPAEPDEEQDRIVFLALGTVINRPGYAFEVADPDLGQGAHSVLAPLGPGAKTWLWSIGLPDSSGKAFVIEESHGSAAVQIFVALRKGLRRNAAEYGPAMRSVVAWYGRGVQWDCRACFSPTPRFGRDSQLFIDGGPERNYASDAVTLHEAGHLAMDVHGFTPSERGAHCFFVPAMPSLAWSEGYANWYSSEIRRDERLYSKQGGTFFFADLDLQGSGPGRPTLPQPSLGLLQPQDEMWIAASLRRIALESEDSAPIWEALASRRMTLPPFARGYFRHKSSGVDGSCKPIDPISTDEPSPIFADFLDALICNGMSPELIDRVVSPHYPYPSDAPLCGDIR